MTGGRLSSTPWHLTIGNPYSPWLSTNHIIVKSATIETSTEMGFNEQPKYLTVKFNCPLSRSLGKQEILRMFNNTYRRNYTSTPPNSESKLFDSNPKQNNVESKPEPEPLTPLTPLTPLVATLTQSPLAESLSLPTNIFGKKT